MNVYELNKIAGAVLGSLLLIMIINEIGNFLVHPEKLEESVLAIDTGATEGAATAAREEAEETVPSLAVRLANADAGDGEKVARKCASCHTFEQGGKNKIGPALYNVVGRDKATVDGFAYSDTLMGLGGGWTYEDLDAFLADPKEFAPGTKMSFAGLRKPGDRADLLLYMREHADSPPPLPTE